MARESNTTTGRLRRMIGDAQRLVWTAEELPPGPDRESVLQSVREALERLNQALALQRWIKGERAPEAMRYVPAWLRRYLE